MHFNAYIDYKSSGPRAFIHCQAAKIMYLLMCSCSQTALKSIYLSSLYSEAIELVTANRIVYRSFRDYAR